MNGYKGKKIYTGFMSIKKIAVTGAAGQIAYSLLFRLANGDFLGPSESIALHLLDIPGMEQALEGIKMELDDCAFSLLKEVRLFTDPQKAFEEIDYAFLVGSKPRGPNMERKDLLKENGKIFVEQGKALNKAAKKEVRVLVVGNPCNTNCLIAMHHAPNLKRSSFHAMTRLDQNRARSLLAQKAGVSIQDVQKVTIWGNHSSTQVPDFFHAQIQGKSALDVLEKNWLEKEFISTVQKRGAAVIQARGKSSAASAANAAIDAFRSIVQKTENGHWFSTAIDTTNNPYKIAQDLIFSFPCISSGKGDVQIVSGLEIPPFLEKALRATEKELIEERDLIKELI